VVSNGYPNGEIANYVCKQLHKINKSSTFTEARLVVVDTHWGVLVIFLSVRDISCQAIFPLLAPEGGLVKGKRCAVSTVWGA
jgi:hypothetical protein